MVKIQAPKTWRDKNSHFIKAINSEWYKVIFELENSINKATTYFYDEKDIPAMYLPITTSSISSPMGLGSDSSPVKIKLFGIDTYLADSMQFMLEYGCRLSKKGGYYILPSFRGEAADERHLCQFFHSEAEIPGKLSDVMDLVQDYVQYLTRYILEHNKESVLKVAGDITHLEKVANFEGEFMRVTMADAIDELSKLENGAEYYKQHECGFCMLTSKGEQKLIELHGGIVWVTHFPIKAVPFYQASDESGELALNADLLFGIGEVVGCGERHNNSDEVLDALTLHQVGEEEYKWYCRMKREFPMKTSGFGMGIERYLLWVLKHNDIRDCQIVPRFNAENIIP